MFHSAHQIYTYQIQDRIFAIDALIHVDLAVAQSITAQAACQTSKIGYFIRISAMLSAP